jgi:mono/diheme cytochrome c family protein
MNKPILLIAGAVALGAASYAALNSKDTTATPTPRTGDPIVAVTVPETLSEMALIGKRAFDTTCATCHGDNAAGVEGSGPPLVHVIYEPSHHGDMAFQVAVQRGVQAHHWRFGNMPAQSGLTTGDVKAITAYVREMQRANGID